MKNYMKGWAPRLVLKKRPEVISKMAYYNVHVVGQNEVQVKNDFNLVWSSIFLCPLLLIIRDPFIIRVTRKRKFISTWISFLATTYIYNVPFQVQSIPFPIMKLNKGLQCSRNISVLRINFSSRANLSWERQSQTSLSDKPVHVAYYIPSVFL